MMNDESMKKPFELRTRTKRYAVDVIQFCVRLPNTPEGWVIRRQLVRCGTSVGAQYREACRARSKAEFVSKMESALQELDETQYWIELAVEAGVAESQKVERLAAETDELIRIFVASVRTSKA